MKKIDDRNLYRRDGVYYYQRVVDGRRERFSTKTSDLAEAVAVRDHWEAQAGTALLPSAPTVELLPTLREFAKRYLKEDTRHLASSTRSDRHVYLRARREPTDEPLPLSKRHTPAGDALVMKHFGDLRLDEITAGRLREWWGQVIETPYKNAKGVERTRSATTGKRYVDVIGSVLEYARDLGLLTGPDAVAEFRKQLKRRSRTKGGRAAAIAERIRPIEDPKAIGRLIAEARAEGLPSRVLVLLLLDAGLRLGEVLGLRWGAVAFGDWPDDTSRHLHIRETRPRGGDPEPPKSGRDRSVKLSARLRVALLELYADRFEPGPEAPVLEGIDPANFRKREWRRILKRAAIGHRALKDLRDTYASQLLTCGVNVAYVSRQLGHADLNVTTRHYARWCGDDEYREPMRLGVGEVPADLLARIAPELTPDQPQAVDVDLVSMVELRGIEPLTLRLPA
jgi:integrase